LDSLHKGLLVNATIVSILIICKDFEDLLKCEVILILDGLNGGACLSKDGINKSSLKQSHIDSISSQEINQVFESVG
jgi:hypothetical protein